MPENIDEFLELKKQHAKNQEKKIRVEERLKTASEDLQKLMKEIKSAGYDPKSIKETLEEKEREFREKLEAFKQEVKQTSEALARIED